MSVHALASSNAILSLCGIVVSNLNPAPAKAKVDCNECRIAIKEHREELIDEMIVLAVDDGGAPGEDILAGPEGGPDELPAHRNPVAPRPARRQSHRGS